MPFGGERQSSEPIACDSSGWISARRFIKGGVLDLDGRKLEYVERRKFIGQLAVAHPSMCEFDPHAIVAAVRALIDELSRHAPDCAGIVMCSQMHGLILVDNHGRVRSNFISWLDERCVMPHPSGNGSYFNVLSRRIGSEQHNQLGRELKPERPLCHLFWLLERGQLERGLIPLSIPDYVLGVLCGARPGVDVTNAGGYGALNLETREWHHEVIMAAGLDHLSWPAIRGEGEIVGQLQSGSRSIPCYAPVGDFQCALAGVLLSKDELSVNVSTGAQVSRLTSELCLGDYQTRPFFDGGFVNTFSGAPGGRSLNLLVKLLGELAAAQQTPVRDPWALIAAAVNSIEDTDLSVDLSFYGAEDQQHGHISNIRANNLTVAHLFRAGFKHMADSYYDCAVRLWPKKGWRNLAFSRGIASGIAVVRETIERKFGCSGRLSPSSEDTLLGLLMLALVFSGRAKSLAEVTEEYRASQPDAARP